MVSHSSNENAPKGHCLTCSDLAKNLVTFTSHRFRALTLWLPSIFVMYSKLQELQLKHTEASSDHCKSFTSL